MRLYKTNKHVSKASGDSICVKCVCDRIKWAALLTAEEKIVVEVLKAQAHSHKAK
ncbi:60S ribosomal protein L34 [Lemmus lemmus]